MNYMVDTNTCIYLMTGHHPERQSRILARLGNLAPDEIWSPTTLESRHGFPG